jgi:hypothetical protein
MNREYLLGAISVYLLIVFHVVRALWRLHVANELEPTVEDIINERNIVENDLMKLSQVEMLQDIDVKKIYKSLREGGIFRIKNIKIYDNIFWVKLNGGDGYFTLYENRVDTISVNHVITVRNGILLHCPVQDNTEYIISD